MRPRGPREEDRLFWAAVSRFRSLEAAAAEVGRSQRWALIRFREAGGIRPRLEEPTVRLSFQERCRIEAMLEAGLTQAAIARKLGRHRSTISREVARNRTVRSGADSAARSTPRRFATAT